jgi:uncharacterized protein (UPF0335 family)
MPARTAPPPVDLTLERINRLEQKVDALIDHQKSVATNLVGSMRDIGNRVDRIEQDLSDMRRDIGEIRQSLREVRIDQVDHTNQILNAIQMGFQTQQRLRDIEGRLPPESP